jgi:hypothetical protein
MMIDVMECFMNSMNSFANNLQYYQRAFRMYRESDNKSDFMYVLTYKQWVLLLINSGKLRFPEGFTYRNFMVVDVPINIIGRVNQSSLYRVEDLWKPKIVIIDIADPQTIPQYRANLTKIVMTGEMHTMKRFIQRSEIYFRVEGIETLLPALGLVEIKNYYAHLQRITIGSNKSISDRIAKPMF